MSINLSIDIVLFRVAPQRGTHRASHTQSRPRAEAAVHATDMHALSNQIHWVRPGVRLGRTTITEDQNGIGLFAPVVATLRGSFIGVYSASQWRLGEGPYKGTNDYVVRDAGRAI